MRSGKTKSCGCLRRIQAAIRFTTHGLRGVPEYNIWQMMKRRCTKPLDPQFPDYGGRGIKVCASWLDSFAVFYADMGPRPTPRHCIDRKDNDGGYEPNNCHWTTSIPQQNNKRNNKRITIAGRTQTLAQWVSERGLNYKRTEQRIRRGTMSAERALGFEAAAT